MRETLERIAVDAGKAILQVYETADFNVEMKSDDSPLTRADLASHAVIVSALEQAYPDIPILSEEGQLPDFALIIEKKIFHFEKKKVVKINVNVVHRHR